MGRSPGEIESLLFCVQTAIGVGIIAFLMGRMVERKKWSREEETEQRPDRVLDRQRKNGYTHPVRQ